MASSERWGEQAMFYQTLYADINQQCFQSKLSPGVLNLLCHPDLCDCTSTQIANLWNKPGALLIKAKLAKKKKKSRS